MLGAFYRDANAVPITTDGVIATTTKNLSGNNTTDAIPLFSILGSVEVRALYGVVTVALGTNQTASYFRLNDATNQSNITLNTGTAISNSGIGSLLVKKGLAGAALTLLTGAQERVSEPTTLETPFFSPFVVVAKNGVTTNIEFLYTTTETPTSGQIQFFARYLPLSAGSDIVPL